jgi:hypothetical protein
MFSRVDVAGEVVEDADSYALCIQNLVSTVGKPLIPFLIRSARNPLSRA